MSRGDKCIEEMDEEKQQLANEYCGYAEYLAHKHETFEVSYEELVGVAYEELCRCAVRFEPERGVKFSTFAMHRIEGALKNFKNEFAYPSYEVNRRRRFVNVSSLDQPFECGDEEMSLLDVLPGECPEDEERRVEQRVLLERIFSGLDEDERELAMDAMCAKIGEREGLEKYKREGDSESDKRQFRRRRQRVREKLQEIATSLYDWKNQCYRDDTQ